MARVWRALSVVAVVAICLVLAVVAGQVVLGPAVGPLLAPFAGAGLAAGLLALMARGRDDDQPAARHSGRSALVAASAPTSLTALVAVTIVLLALGQVLIGALQGARRGLSYDPELLFVGAMFHDIGLVEGHRSAHDRFEVDGANAAREFLAGHGVSLEEISRQTTENFFRLFSKVPRPETAV